MSLSRLSPPFAGNIDFVALACAGVAFAVTKVVAGIYCLPVPSGKNYVFLPAPRDVVGIIFGAAIHIMRSEAGTIQNAALALGHGRPAGLRSIDDTRLMLADPKDAEYLLIDRPGNFVKSERYRILKQLLGDGLVTIENEDIHAVHRRAINPSFSTAAVKRFAVDIFAPHFDRLAKKLETEVAGSAGSTVEPSGKLQEIFDGATLQIVSEAAFRSTRFETLSQIMNGVRIKATALFLLPAWIFNRLPTALRRNARAARGAIETQLKLILNETRAQGPPLDGQGKSLIDYLAFSSDLDDALLLDQSVTFVFAGSDTTSTALNWILIYLARFPAVQAKLYEEVCGSLLRGSVPTLETVEGLPYLKNVIKETLRIQPPVFHVIRLCKKDDILPHSGVFIPAGTQVFISIYAIHHNANVYGADVKEFKPERWDDPTLAERVGPCGWMPFLAGKRNCVGKDFAFTELLLAVAMIVRRMEVVWPEGQSRPFLQAGPIVRPRDPVKLIVRKRPE